jgi:predicted nucleotidyltransferase
MESYMKPEHRTVLDKFVKACQADERIVAAFLVGSYVNGEPDEYSDLDLYLITTDEAYDDFVSTRESFIRMLGEPLFTEDFDASGIVFLIFPDGAEVELSYSRESQVNKIFNESFQVLLDKKNITRSLTPHERETDPEEQREKLRRLIYWFWHDFSHFVTALGRDQLWWAQGQLAVLRSICAGLARLKNDFTDPEVDEEVFFKIEKAMPVESLLPLQDTFCPMDRAAMLEVGQVILDCYKKLAVPLSQEHGIHYPDGLERVMVARFETVTNRR